MKLCIQARGPLPTCAEQTCVHIITARSVSMEQVLESCQLLNTDCAECTYSEACGKQKYICLYFSASWCRPCVEFTPHLKAKYAEMQSRTSDANQTQIVLVPMDQSPEQGREYFRTMPWYTIEFDESMCDSLANSLNVNTVPTLLVFRQNGKLVTASGYRELQEHVEAGTTPEWL